MLSKRLPPESEKWVSSNIISSKQRDGILAFYDNKRGRDLKKMAPLILCVLGCVLLAVGLFLFYAANWKYMSSAFKVAQVFLLIILFYCISYYLINKTNYVITGRVFFLLGILSYGLGIALIAQIFHITAHGGTGTLLWFLGAFSLSWVMEDRWGLYVSAGLLFLWTSELFLNFNDPNYIFPVFAAALGWRFYRLNSKGGIIAVVFQLLYWWFHLNFYFLPGVAGDDLFIRFFLWLFLPMGIILAALGRMWRKNTLGPAGKAAGFTGWIFTFLPWLALSWPLGDKKPSLVYTLPGGTFFYIQYLLLIISAAGLIYYLYLKKNDFRMPLIILLLGVLVSVLPLGNQTVLVISTHLGLVACLGIYFYFSYGAKDSKKYERFASGLFIISSLIIKAAVFFGYGMTYKEFYLAYSIGTIVFTTVCFLLIRVMQDLLRGLRPVKANLLNGVCGFIAYLSVYALSFEVESQNSIFRADPIVLVMLGLFVLISVLFYAFLYIRSEEKVLLSLSAFVFFISVGVLLYSGPEVSWILYSIFFNLLLFAVEATYVYYAVHVNSRFMLNAAIAGFSLHILTRYFDLLFDMLSGSALFIITGMIVLGGGYILERSRRNWLKEIRADREAGL